MEQLLQNYFYIIKQGSASVTVLKGEKCTLNER